ncbi:MAG: PhzF family phenazine biosynthesis protein [Clostridium sp.]|jgi:PhzF family phenazine biosynthesis protein|uniref:PhzF family phenazine biosynthesis protein n=1 Tax=Clostridium sp. TaxID=1506 RepID=UPI0025BAE728|nr:PhzF family phenazine biosynthesis protein [Clostridium sp.]MCH3963356.1 PhzF family phenazine biosynthesis protein [Clostridium sp.]MCI1716776.1 PhzF family phenazine biosynthesis protein [Clostridium sp.]MCI1801040.1 PhzF family phenazine biosynthesis protein [Clostridium sp.]MCI1814962.1 PhzF family phenazine biosynthesis protein [Clostridium sp.]MCI1871863.1 PhzF family phenazine biosynthesis protein [Clostridium sp.]
MKYYVVDAFTDRVFKGNPAGICVLDRAIDEELMQKIAYENNLSETAFVVKNGNSYDLRWFTPKAEIDLCGHATLGTAYVISNYVDVGIDEMKFNTVSGVLGVKRINDLYEMDLHSREPRKVEISRVEIEDVLKTKVEGIYLSRDLFVLLQNEQQVKNISPDFSKMIKVKEGLGVIVTARGNDVDFISRCFYPKLGVNEDPVTGSAHSSLIPFWSKKLGKEKMLAQQISKRGGMLYCEMAESRVKVSGKAAIYMEGNINI